MKPREILYFDHAATSWPKPPTVREAMIRALEACGNPGRGTHRLALNGAETVDECRRLAGELFGVPAENVIFTSNTTAAINLLLRGTLRPGDHVLCSDLEHNAVRRPLEAMQSEGRIEYGTFSALGTAESVVKSLDGLIRPDTRAVICLGHSNVCGAALPLGDIGRYCRRHGLLFFVDGAQSAGHVPLRLDEIGADAICVPGHKGLLGPMGIGVAVLREGLLPEPSVFGGTGIQSLEAGMPEFLPERLEAGTLPVPAIAGLGAALSFYRDHSAEIASREREAAMLLENRLRNDGRLTVFGPTGGTVFSCRLEGVPDSVFQAALSRSGVAVRTGFHCAPWAHRAIGSGDGGTVRFSVGWNHTAADVARLDRLLTRIRRDFAGQ